MKNLRRFRSIWGALMTILLALGQILSPLSAATVYWDADATASGNSTSGTGLGGSGIWDASSLNWWDAFGSDSAWINGANMAVFSGTSGTVTLGAPITAGGLTFNSSGYTVAGVGNALTLSGAVPVVTVSSAGASALIQSDVVLGSSAGLGGAGDLTFNTGVISGAGFGFTKVGSGTLTLGGANTFSGPVAIRGGVVSISGASNLGDGSASNTLTLGTGTLRTSGTFNLGANRGPILATGGGTIDVTSGNLTVDGTITVNTGLATNVSSLTKVGAGTLMLTGATNNVALFNTSVNAGTLSFGAAGNLGSGFVALNGGTLQNTATATITNVLKLGSAGGTVEVTGAGTLTGSGVVTGPGSLTKTGTGTYQLGAAATYAGATIINGGTLNGGVASFLPAGTQVSVASGSTLNLNAVATTVASISGAGVITNTGAAAALTLGNFAGSQNTTFSGSFNATTAANLTLTKTAGGTLTITSSTPGSASGAWTLNAGTVNVDYATNGSSTGNILTSRAMTLTGGTLQITGRSGATVTQGLGAITIGARGGQIVVVDGGGGGSTTLSLGTLAHVTTAGASLLINSPANTAVKTSTTTLASGVFGGRYVYTNGTAYDWATNGGVAANAITGLAGGSYAALNLTTDTVADTNNSLQTDSGVLTAGTGTTRTTNTLKIATTTPGQSLDLGANNLTLTAGGLLFTGSNAYTISGTTGVLASGTATNSDLIIHQYGSGALTISAIIGNGIGASTLTKAGTGTLILGSTNTNTYTGATFINAGTLSISSNNLGATATSAITINDGATLQTTATLSTGTHTFSLTGGNATFDIAPSTTFTIGGVISGAGGLTLNNSGTLTMTAAATYTGPTYVNSGTLLGGVTAFINAATGGNLNVGINGTVEMNDKTLTVGGIAGAGNITNNLGTAARILTVGGNNQSTTYSGVLSATTAANLALTKNGSGVLTLGGVNTYTGATLLNYGTIKFGVDNALAATGMTIANANASGPIPVSLDLDGHAWTSGAITFYGSTAGATSQGVLNIGPGGVLTLGGTLTVTATNNPLGAQVTGGTIELSATRSFAINDSTAAAADLSVTSIIASTAGSFGITKSGAGTLLLTGANTYSGTTTVSAGTLLLAGGGTVGGGSSALVANATVDLNGTSQAVGNLTGTTGIIQNSASSTLSTLAIGNGTTVTTSGIYSGTVIDGGGVLALVKNGSGSIALTGVNAYSGGTQVNAGTLTYGNTSAQPATGTTQVASGAALGLGVGGAGFYSSADVDALFANTLTNVNMASGANVGIDTTAGDFTYATNQSAARGLVKLGTNTLFLTGSNTYTGGTTVLGGLVSISSDAQLGAVGGALTLNGGGLQITGTADTAWNNSRTLNLAGAVTFDVASQSNLNSGYLYTVSIPAVTAAGSITKSGAGTLNLATSVDLNGNSLFVNNGILRVTNSITSAALNPYYIGNTALAVGNGGGAIVVASGGSLNYAGTDGSDILRIGNIAGGFGSLTVENGGSVVTSRWRVGMAGTGVANILTGGTVTLANYNIGGTANTGVGVLNIAGGTLNGTMSSGNGAWAGARYEQNIGVNLGGGNSGGVLDMSNSTQNFGIVQNSGAGVGIANIITGGTLKLKTSITPIAITTGRAELNFHGGTVEYAGTAANTNFIQTGLTAVNVWSEGAIINTGGQNLTVPAAMIAPAGAGVDSISASGSGYFTAPDVRITGGGGDNNATAVAQIDSNGNITGIIITNPGTNYTSTPTVTLVGGTNGTVGTATATLNAGNVSGGLTKTGAGILTLTGINTYSGDTIVNGGSLSIAPTALPNTANLWVGKTGTGSFDLYQDGTGAAWTPALNTNIILGNTSSKGSLGFQLGTASDRIVLSGTGALTVNSGAIDAIALSGFGVGSYDVITGASSITGLPNLQLGNLPGGYTYSLTSSGGKVTLNVLGTAAAGNLYWTGDASTSWATLGGGNSNWSTTADGLTEAGFSPGSSNVVYFSATNAGASPINTTLENNFSIQGLKFINSGTGAVSIAAGTVGSLTIGSGGIEVQTGAPASTTISAPVTLGSAQTWNVAGSTALAVSGVLGGGVGNSTQASPGSNVSLSITGGGAVTISGTANTFTGDILVDASTLNVTNDRSWGGSTVASSTSHTITLINGARLGIPSGTINPGATTTTNYNLVQIGSGGAIIEPAAGATLQLDDAGQLFGAGDLTKAGGGTLFLGNAYTNFTAANVYLNGGVLRLNNSSALGTSAKTLYLGDTTGANDVTLQVGTNSSLTIPSAVSLNVRSGGSGVKTIAGTNTSGTNTIAGTIALNDNVVVDVVSGGGLTLSGVISEVGGARTITKTGAGTFTLGGVVNSISGGILVKAGTLTAGNNASTLGAAGNIVTLGDSTGSANTTLTMVNSFTYTQPFVIASGNTGTATIIGGNSTGTVVSSGGITLNSHDLTLSKTGTTGSYTVSTNPITGTGNLTLSTSGTTGTMVISAALNESGTITSVGTGTGSTTISGSVGSGVTNITQNSTTSALVLSGANQNFGGSVTVTAGTLQMNGAASLNAANVVSVASGAIFNVNASGTIGGLQGLGTVTNTGTAKTLTLGGNGTYSFGGALTATTPANLSLVVALSGSGSQTLYGASTYTGSTTINRGTLVLDFNQASVVTDLISSSSPLVLGGGTLSVIGDALSSSQTFASTTLSSVSYSGLAATAGAGGLAVNLGTLTRNINSGLDVASLVNNPNLNFTGISVANGLAVGSNGVAFLTVGGSDWGTMSGNNPVAYTGYVNDTYTGATDNVNVTTSGSWSGTTINTLRFNTGSPTLTLSGTNSLGAGGLLVGSGAGSVTLSGTGTLSGSAATGTVAAPVVGELGVFQNSSSAMTILTAVTNNALNLSYVSATPAGTALNKYGSGTLILSSPKNSYSGGTNVAGGVLKLGASEVIPDGAANPGAVTIAGGAVLDLNGFSETINGLAGAGTVDNTSATAVTLYEGNTNATSSFSGVIQNSGGGALTLVKTGTGTLTLNSASTYTGSTIISGGGITLNFTVAGAPLSNILSSSSALVLGSGTLTVTGSTTVNSQSFNGTTINGGARVTQSGTTPALTVNLGSIARTAGSGATLNVTLVSPGVVTTTNTNDATGILGSWAVVNSADFATVNGSNQIVAYAGYTTVAGSTGAGNATQNALFNSGNTVDAATVDFNTIKIGTAAPSFAAAGNILRLGAVGAILMPTGAAATSIGSAAGNGILTAGGAANTAGELDLINWSSNALTINSAINNNGTGVVTLVKSGTGGVTLATSNGYTGGTIINGGTLTVSAANQLSTGAITLNGGALTFSADAGLTLGLVLGAGGGTLNYTGVSAGDRTYGATGAIGTSGIGARTLTVSGGGGDRRVILQSNLIDGTGGATSMILSLGGDNRVIRLSGTNTYTGTTTITRGVLDFSAVAQFSGGVTSAATVGNIIFGATGTNRAILQSSVSTPVTLSRFLGYGDGQIHWEGNGGFSNNIANTTWAINLGGAGATLVWGQGGFVPTGSSLQFGMTSITNSITNLGAVDFQNGIDFGSVTRSIEVLSANDKQGNTPYDAILSGSLTSSAGGGFSKSGSGVLILSGANNAAPTSVTLTAGGLVFASQTAIPGSGANLTLSTTAGGNSFIGVAGDIDPISTLGARIANPLTATSAFTIGADSNVNLDFTNYPNMRLAAYAYGLPAKAITYTGTLTPAASTYLFGGSPYASDPSNTLATTLVIAGVNHITGTNAVAMSYGNLTLISPNNYTGGTTLDGNGIGNANLMIGNNAALGTGNLSLTGNQTKTLGAVNGDRLLANNIAWAGSATSFVAAADGSNDGASNTNNGGGITYLGTITISDTAGAPTIVSRTGHQVLLLGNVNNGALTSGLTYSASTAGLISSLATSANGGVAKTYNGTSIINSTSTLVIDSDASLGNGGNISMGGGGSAGNTATLRLQPGTGAVTLAAGRTISFSADRNFELRIGSGGTLTLAGVLNAQGANTAARNIIKTDAGTLVFTNKNLFTGAATSTPGLAIRGGAIQLDSSAGTFTAATDRFFPDATNALPVAFSAASGTFGGGGTLEIIQAASNAFSVTQGFGNLTFNTGGNAIKLTNNSSSQGLTLNLGSTFTRTSLLGGTVNFVTSTAGGTNTIGSAVANTNNIIGGYATFNGLDWATQSGGAIIAYSGYTSGLPASGSTAAGNYLQTGSQTVTASQTINSLKFAPASGTQTLTINSGFTQTVSSGGLLFDNSNGSATITGAGQFGATGAELIVHTFGGGDITTNKLTLNGVVKGSATVLSKSGPGTLVLSGTNTYTGALIINAGVVEYSNGSATGQNLGSPTAGAGNIILNGGTLRQTATNNLIFGMTVNGYANLDVPTGVTLTQTAQGITGLAGVTAILKKTGAGTVAFSGSSDNPSLSLEVVGGTVNLGKTSSATVHAVGVASGSTAAATLGASLIVDSTATVNITGSGGDQIHDQSSVLVRTGGTLNLGGGAATSESFDGLAGGGTVTNSGLTGTFNLTLGAGNDVNISAYSLAAADAGVGSTGLNNFSGVIADGGAGKVVALTKIGGGTQILSGNSTYSGATNINAGTLQLGVANALPSGAGKGNVNLVGNGYGAGTINGGTVIGTADKIQAPGTLDMGGFDQAINGLNSSTGGFVVNNPTLAWNGSAWVAASSSNTLTVGNGDASGSFNGVIMDGYTVAPGAVTAQAFIGTLSVTKAGSGTQTLGGTNTYGGSTAVTGGTLAAAASNVIPSSSAVTLAPSTPSGSAALNLNGFNNSIASLTIAGAAGSTSSVQTGAGTLTLLGNLTYDATSNPGAATIQGNLSLGGSTRVFNVADSTATTSEVTVNAVISDGPASSGLTKTGTGTTVLTAANTYTGSTTVSSGTLQVGNAGAGSTSASSTVTVNGAGATLAGSGTVQGNVNVVAGSLRPGETGGAGISQLTVNGNLSVSSGGTLEFKLVGADSPADAALLSYLRSNPSSTTKDYLDSLGTLPSAYTNHNGQNDFLSVGGTLAMDAGGTVTLVDGIAAQAQGDIFHLIDWATLTSKNSSAAFTGAFTSTSSDFVLPTLTSGLAWDVSAFKTYGIVSIVPEPSRAMLLLAGLALAMMRRRRR